MDSHDPAPELTELARLVAAEVVRLLDLPARRSHQLIDAREVARGHGIDRSWVYAHAEELGVVRLGTGSRPRLRFDHAYRRREYLTLGSAAVGWDRARAETELANILAAVRRGTWRPATTEKPAEPLPEPTFHEFASEWLAGRRAELRPSTQYSYEWALRLHLLPFFARHRLSEITSAQVDRCRSLKVRQGQITARSINQTITRLAQILEYAVEYEYIARNPARGETPPVEGADRAAAVAGLRRPHHRAARRSGTTRSRGPRRPQGPRERATLATLTLSGLRIGELCALRWRDVDLAAGRTAVRASKTRRRHAPRRPAPGAPRRAPRP